MDNAHTAAVGTVGRVAGGLVVLAAAAVTFLFLPFLTMASDSCFEGDTRTICGAAGQQAVALVPQVAGFLAAALAVCGMAWRARGGVICLLVAPALLGVAWLTDFAIVGS
ncbi:hypothetical protein [Streptomyces olivaceiscleroticus]|uniref:Uncharacterized protein n=1 Tax=Streptomyces olivaceiscleroticus TaxID=68245 RepID=A0ABN1AUF0_9ACTN